MTKDDNFNSILEKGKLFLQKTLFPKAHKCIFCGREIYKDNGLYSTCDKCFEKLPYRLGEYCLICGDPAVERNLCKRCRDFRPDFSALYAPFNYTQKVSSVAVGYKDKPNKWMAPYIAKYMADWYNTFNIVGEVMVYVPSSPDAIKSRRFDHNELVAEELAKMINIPVVNALSCSGMVSSQTENDREMRSLNVVGAFHKSEDYNTELIENKDVILIDDVVTTGATVRECARVLMQENKAKSVRVLAFARR
ncbi:MAG: double zinc ribbon domain-containing protein [Bacillota bacterium]